MIYDPDIKVGCDATSCNNSERVFLKPRPGGMSWHAYHLGPALEDLGWTYSKYTQGWYCPQHRDPDGRD